MTKLSILAAVLLCACAGMLPGAGQNPVITTATINSAANQIAITGLNLAPATGTPAVGLGNAELTVVSASATQIVATLPASLAPGSYQLKVLVGTVVAGSRWRTGRRVRRAHRDRLDRKVRKGRQAR